ncbi:hypothetical protein D9742_07910 [Escherichia sp. E1V33]|nr:hypothetical protein D9742_07910 [Escherichia sp. E1V33]TBR62952.1 hypothetical protein D9735_19390 [Escherichia sp. E1S7]
MSGCNNNYSTVPPVYRQPWLHRGTLATRLENQIHFLPGSKSRIHCAPDLVIDDQNTAAAA